MDYLLKPVDPLRFQAALQHLRASHARPTGNALQGRLARFLDRILLKVDGEIVFLDPDEIGWVEAAGNYVDIHLRGQRKFLRETLSALERKLTPYGFLRISRSVLVNSSRTKTMKPAGCGEYAIHLLDATELTLSRGYREAFFERFNLC